MRTFSNYATCNFAHETGIYWLGFRRPDGNVIAEQGGGPDARPLWAASGPRAGGCSALVAYKPRLRLKGNPPAVFDREEKTREGENSLTRIY